MKNDESPEPTREELVARWRERQEKERQEREQQEPGTKRRSRILGITLLILGIALFGIGVYYYIHLRAQGGDEGFWGSIIALFWTLLFGIPSFIAGIVLLRR